MIGFHASHEQIDPRALLAAVKHAEEVGFTAAMCSDHIAPWSVRQGQSGFAWSWLGAALEATDLPFGVVNAPGQRYHPAVIAQAIGTLGQMYPGRFWAALGSGENVNEHITGEHWPRKDLRNARLEECVKVMRALLNGEEVSLDHHVSVDRARVWSRPDTPPPLVAAAVSAETAGWAASWADGLVTVAQPPEKLRRVLDAYEQAGGTGRRALQIHLSWASTDAEALAIAHDQWRTNAFDPPVPWDIDTPENFDEISKHVAAEDLRASVLINSDLGWHADKLAELAGLGFDDIYLHHVGRKQQRFLDAFGERVLPQLTSALTAKAVGA
ncbi:LLM class F420-dependent oxidoreductase [Cryobacterium sp. LW097]|uniref:TIGR03885 family FMN-dependent LLM class oxidoreductase n=1 Tax=Cryobacterium sp. LW097 TaxID=1978566 RepID=UPI000B4C71B6|nr:TIGR03885 family FMN-dependent LLM class oxidoreductase [Cryobacterium sp. LW097]ASD22883.1 LLM class F420-dependent oxidoreductase [Cryobacterium sp. LW097]